MIKEPVMIFATATIDSYIPAYNLSAIYKHYRTYSNLCLTIKSPLGT